MIRTTAPQSLYDGDSQDPLVHVARASASSNEQAERNVAALNDRLPGATVQGVRVLIDACEGDRNRVIHQLGFMGFAAIAAMMTDRVDIEGDAPSVDGEDR